MAGTRRLIIEIVGNAKDAAAAFGDVRKHSDITKERLDKFGTAALGAGVAIAAGLAFAVKEFADADTQSRKLDNSISNSTQSFARGGDAIRQLTTELQNLTGADGDALVGAASIGVQWGLTEQQLTELLPLVNDLSLKMGTDVDSAMKAVLKSTDGSATALRKMGIDVDATKAKADPFAATMDALNSSVGGFGQTVGDTAAGKLNTLKQQLGDIIESVGGGAMDVFGPFVSGLTSLTGASSESTQSIGTFAGQFGVVASAALIGVGGLVKMKGAVDSAKGALTNGEGALNGFGKAATALAAVAAVVPIFDALAAAINEGSGVAQQEADAWNALSIALNKAGGDAEGVWDSFSKGVAAEQSTNRFQNLWQEFGAEIELVGTGAKADVEQVQRAFDDLGKSKGPEAQKAALDELAAATAQLPKNSDQYKTNTEFIERNRKSLDLKTKASKDEAAATKDSTAAIDEHTAATKAATDPVFAALRATNQNNEAQGKFAEALGRVNLLTAAGKTGTADYAKAQSDLRMASVDAGQAAVGQQGALLGLAGAMQTNKSFGKEFQSTLTELQTRFGLSKEAAFLLAGAFTGVGGQALSAAGGINGLGITADRVDGTRVDVTVSANTAYIDSLNQKLIGLNALLSSGRLTPAQIASVNQEANAARRDRTRPSATGQRATGGSVLAGRTYLVGERGPELIVPGSGYVIPNRELVTAGSRAEASTTINVNVTAGVGDPVEIGRQVVESLRQYERATGTAWRA